MAYKNYRPSFEFLKSLGFEEKSDKSGHPYGVWHELPLNDNMQLSVCAFSDFSIDITDAIEDDIPVLFECDEQLVEFIKSFESC